MGNKKRSNPYKTKQNSTALCDRDSQVVQWWGTAVASEMSGLEDWSSFCNIFYLLKQTMDKDNEPHNIIHYHSEEIGKDYLPTYT
jgi:hypothetical protein